ncbi:MAG: L-lactate dehydrogenase [Patescibacteria group bacterium]
MIIRHRKITIIGAGYVGSTTAFAPLSARAVNELCLIDVNTALVRAQVMDLQHAVPFLGTAVVKVGNYSDIRTSAVVVIAAGANQKPGETRLDLIQKNSALMRELGPKVFMMNPEAIVIVVTNPVDVLTYQLIRMFPGKKRRIIGSGTVLDSARLRHLVGAHFNIDPTSVHAYICGEHGDSEFPLWSTANIGQVPILSYPGCTKRTLDQLFMQAKNAAYTIIAGKQATYYAIAAGVTHIVEAIFGDRNEVLPVSHLLMHYHGVSDVCLSVPAVVGRNGVRTQLSLKFSAREERLLRQSAAQLKRARKGIH